MIELNLLPDVKMEYIKAQNLRRMTFTISALVTVVAVVLLGFLISVNQLQKKHLSDLTDDITRDSAQLKSKKDISKILTVQNQLASLTALHAGKPAASSLFTYLNQVTPSDVDISNLHVDFTANTMAITGGANSLSDVNKYIDTLKFTTYKTADGGKTAAFGNVVMSSFAVNSEAKDGSKPASYTINLSYDPKIFDITQKVTLKIPNITTTRASLDNPTPLFQAGASTTATGTTSSAGSATTPATTSTGGH
jgi:Tfp pilus assembly protein PilN